MKITDVSFFDMDKGNLKAFAKIVVDNILTITGVKIMDGNNGLFMAWPSRLNEKDKKWYDIVYITDKVRKQEFNDKVVNAYKAYKGESAETEEDDDLPF
jgi:stage V sporulation protein G